MKNLFRGYYRPSEDEFSELWRTAIIALDANVLLNLYRYSVETRDKLISILREFEERLWLPHQAAFEFHKNRLKVISDQQEAYAKVIEIIASHKDQLVAQLGEFKRHPHIRTDALHGHWQPGFDAAIKMIDEQNASHPSLLDNDEILTTITGMFEGRVGNPHNVDALSKIFKDGEARYAKSRPPGYKDAKTKDGDDKFGDLVLWYQLIDCAIERKLPIILVTDDVKEDWWTRLKGKTIGPRPELVSEMREKASVDFYMYKTDQFMDMSNKFARNSVPKEMLDEVRDIRSRAIMRTLFDSDQFVVKGAERDKLISIYNELIAKKIAVESEIKEVTDALENETKSSQEAEFTYAHRDHLLMQLKSLEVEISDVSSSISLKRDAVKQLSLFDLFSKDNDWNSDQSRKLITMYYLLNQKQSSEPNSDNDS